MPETTIVGNPFQEDRQPGRPRRRGRWLWIAGMILGALGLGAAFFLQSHWFHEFLRRQLVEAIERTTGTRVELEGFAFSPSRLEAQLVGLTLHGKESSQEPPLFSAERIEAQWKLTSIWDLRADWRRLRVWGPKIFIAMDEAGHSNLPAPPARRSAGAGWLKPVFALQIRQLEVLRGEFRWKDRPRQFDFRAENFLTRLDYDFREQRYTGRLDLQNALLTLGKSTPLASRARLQFSVSPHRAEIESFEWDTLRSHAQVQGTIENFQSPQVQLRSEIRLDLEEAGKFLGSPGWQGDLVWRGQGSNNGQGWKLEGDLRVRNSRSGVPALRAIPWSAQAVLRLTRPVNSKDGREPSLWRAELENLDVAALGGRFTGSATVEVVSSGPTARLDLQAQRISLPALLRAVSRPALPLEQLQWAGTVSGPVEARFIGLGRDLHVNTDWAVSLPPLTPPGFLPVSGRLRGSYRAATKRLEVENSSVELPETRLTAEGWVSEKDSHLAVGLETTELEDSRPLRELVSRRYAVLPVHLQGRAKGQFLWSGGSRHPKFDGQFDVTQFSYRNIRWDHFSGILHYRSDSERSGENGESAAGPEIAAPGEEPSELAIENGKLTRGPAVAEFGLRLGLREGSWTRRSPFSVHATVRHADLDNLQKVRGVRYPIRGVLQATLEASGTREDPRGKATVTLAQGDAYQEPFDFLTAELVLESGGAISAPRIRLAKGKGILLANARFDRKTKAFRFALTGSDFPLQEVHWLATKHFPIAGLARIHLSGNGSLSEPRLEGEMELRGLALRGMEGGNLSVSVETKDQRARLRGNASLFGASLQVSGEVGLTGSFPATARLSFENLDVPKALRTVLALPQDLTAWAGGIVVAEGPLREPRKILVRAEMTRLDVALEAVSFRPVSPLRWQYGEGAIRLERVHLQGQNLDLETAGTVRLSPEPSLNLAAEGRADLAVLRLLDPQVSSSGQVHINASVSGTLDRPVWRGRLVVSDGNLRYGNLPNGLAKIQGTVLFEGNQGLLENMTAESGGGQIRLGGFLAYAKQTGWQFQLAAGAEAVRVRYPAGISTVLDGRLTWGGTAQASLLAGRLEIRREAVNPNFDLAEALLRPREDNGTSPRSAFIRSMRLDLSVVSAPDIRLETTAARNLQGDVDLRIQGTMENPVWLGRIGILEGELYFAGKKYTVNRGEIAFTNPFRFEPILSLNIQARVQQYDISMDFSGPPERLTVTYHSDPPLPTGDILALLVAGSSRQPLNGGTPSQVVPQLGAQSILTQALSSQIGSRLDRIFGAGRIRVDPQLAGFNRQANASVAFEQQFRDDFTLTYVTNVTSVRQQIIQGEWAVSPRFSVIGIRDQNGLIGVNFQIRLRFR